MLIGQDHCQIENPLLDIVRSSAKAEYRTMAHTSCEFMWIKHLLEELKFVVKVPMTMHCDNKQQFTLPPILCSMSEPSI